MSSPSYQILLCYFRRRAFWFIVATYIFFTVFETLMTSSYGQKDFNLSYLLFWPVVLQSMGTFFREHIAKSWVLMLPEARRKHLIVSYGLLAYFLLLIVLAAGATLDVSPLSFTALISLVVVLSFAAGYRPSFLSRLLLVIQLIVFFMGYWYGFIDEFLDGNYPGIAVLLLLLSGAILVQLARRVLRLTEESPEYHFKHWSAAAMRSGTSGAGLRQSWFGKIAEWFGRESQYDYSQLKKYAEYLSDYERIKHWRWGLAVGGVRLGAALFCGFTLLVIMTFVRIGADVGWRVGLGFAMSFLTLLPVSIASALIMEKMKYVDREVLLPIPRAQYVNVTGYFLLYTTSQYWVIALASLLLPLGILRPQALQAIDLWGQALLSAALQFLSFASLALAAVYTRKSITAFQVVSFSVVGVISCSWTILASSSVFADYLTHRGIVLPPLIYVVFSLILFLVGILVGRIAYRKWLTVDW